ncbi:MAG: phospho-sugar mutase [Thermoguttaceae bacterium]|jgi:phosphoglucomutase/phosphomannomutase
MNDTNADISSALEALKTAGREGKLSPAAVKNIRKWLTEPYLAEYAPLVAQHISAGRWKELDDAFWTVIPFGTGGRRGRMYPIGCNAINDRTIGESAQGLADYVQQQVKKRPLSCAIAYDTRHQSRHFAELCAEIMSAAGFTVYFLDGYRSTPELSFAVRYKKCDCGIIITASHNPPSDNAVKVYWSTGGQLLHPHDTASIHCMQKVTGIQRVPFSEGLSSGKIVYCQEEVDPAYISAVLKQSIAGPRELKIIYSPLHGVGASAVCPVLEQAGFKDVEVFAPHAAPDGDFPNIPKHIANPENAAVFDAMIECAKEIGADLILATDPDCDRLGCAIPKSQAPNAPWVTLTGNQIGSLLAEFLLNFMKVAGHLTTGHYIVKTLVTTELMRRIADFYGVHTYGNLLVGFKYIGGEMDYRGPERFVLGAEESYGFLIGDHARDKDAPVASLLLAELAARAKAEGETLYQKLDDLFRQHGCHSESQLNVQMPGEKGMEDMAALMAKFHSTPPKSVASLNLVQTRDYLTRKIIAPDGASKRLDGPKGDLVILDLEGGNYVAVRPSGTEPKVKFYMFAFDLPDPSADLDAVKFAQAKRLKAMEADLKVFSGV